MFSYLYNFLHSFVKRCWILLAILIIAIAVISSFFRALTPWATQYKPEIEQHLSTLLGKPVTISSMETGWYWFEPVIKLSGITIVQENNKSLQLKKLLVGVNLFSSLLHWQIQPGILYIDKLNLTVRQQDNKWKIEGFNTVYSHLFNKFQEQSLVSWLLNQQRIVIKDFSAQIYLQDNSLISLQQLNLKVARTFSRYAIQGNAILAQNPSTSIELLADLMIENAQLEKANGAVFLSLDNLNLHQWQSFLSAFNVKVTEGQGDIQLWLDLTKGHIAKAQSRINLNQFVVVYPNEKATLDFGNPADKIHCFDDIYTPVLRSLAPCQKDGSNNKPIALHSEYSLKALRANAAWMRSDKGWQITADHINLGLKNWPENKLIVRSQPENQSFIIYLDYLKIEPVLKLVSQGVVALKPLLNTHFRGILTNTQIEIKNETIDYVLTKFDEISWITAENIPGVENLSGVISWQPTEGHLELEGKNTLLYPFKKTPISFNEVNGVFDWKELSHGLHLSIDSLVINHPELIISASGNIDDLTLNSAGQVNLSAQLSAKSAEQWLPYIPASYLKKKLNDWLKNDIKKIDNITAELSIHGQAADFPFDKQLGEFNIKAYANGLDLYFAPLWPLTTGIDAYLNVDKRLLNVDISHAKLTNIDLGNSNLRVEGIGLDHEILLFHSLLTTNAKKALAYLRATPLNKKLSALNKIDMQGPMTLDFHLEAPLYPENDDILVLGDITFKDNQLCIKPINNLLLDNVQGSLQFDQEGIIEGSLNAALSNYPVAIQIQSLTTPVPATTIKIDAKSSLDSLRKQFDWPILSLMDGNFSFDGLLTITNNPKDLDSLHIESSLEGVRIDLPTPFAKSETDVVPLSVDMAFNSNESMAVSLNYGERLSSYLMLTDHAGHFSLDRGQILLGNKEIKKIDEPGVHIQGSIALFDLNQWQRIYNQLVPEDSDESLVSHSLQSVHLLIKQLIIGIHHYDDFALNAIKLSNDNWSLKLQQKQIAGNLTYNFKNNHLKGTLTKLFINDEDNKIENDTSFSSLKANKMPNLDLTINSLQIKQFELGKTVIKATALSDKWQVNSCQITAPFYQLNAQGAWIQDNKANYSEAEINLSVDDLAKTLAFWNINPVVEGHKGHIYFSGHWPGGIQQFSLTALMGKLFISFKDGRITHLSKEAESKLDLGKLLSILSLQTIPRRLKLDFSDLSEEGYSFDEFKGNFIINKGLMRTQDSYLDGPIAYASINGDLNIAKQLYDLNLTIYPHVTASLPIVATIAGGPIAGLATWVVSKIINKGMQKISNYTYKISGPWQDPLVQQVSIKKKRVK